MKPWAESPGEHPSGTLALVYNTRAREVRERGPEVQNHPQPHSAFKANLGYMKVKIGARLDWVHGLGVIVLCSKPKIIDKMFHFVRSCAGLPLS